MTRGQSSHQFSQISHATYSSGPKELMLNRETKLIYIEFGLEGSSKEKLSHWHHLYECIHRAFNFSHQKSGEWMNKKAYA